MGPGRLSIPSVLKGILALQLALAGLMLLGDAIPSRPGSGAPNTPTLQTPVRPGDQTRRYQRDAPSAPNRPYDMPAGLPSRLSLERVPDQPDARALIGEIAPGDADRILDQLQAAAPALLYLNSPGGSVMDALAIGRFLREAEIDTHLAEGDICLSACPYIFAGGPERRVEDGGALGVHQHYFGENTFLPAFLAVEDIQRGQGEVMTHLDAMGLDVLLMQHALVTGPDDIYIFLPEELTRYRIVTD